MTRHFAYRLAAAVSILALVRCGTDGSIGPEPVPASIAVLPDSVRLVIGDSSLLASVVLDGAGQQISGMLVSFVSSAPAVASVSPGGLVTAVGIGVATVTASTGELQASVPVVVVSADPPRGFTLEVFPDTITLGQLEAQDLSAVVLDSLGLPVPGVPVAFVTDDAGVVLVSAAGRVSSVGPARETAVTVGAAGLSQRIPVYVRARLGAIDMAEDSVFLKQAEGLQLTVQPRDLTGAPMANVLLFFSTADPGIATVSGTGVVTGVAPGRTIVAVNSGSVVDWAAVTVTDSSIVARTLLPGRGWGIDVAPSGAGYVTLPDMHSIMRFTLPDTTMGTTVGVGIGPIATSLLPSGSRAYVANQFFFAMTEVNVATNSVVRTINFPHNLLTVRAAPDGSRVWIAAGAGVAYGLDPSSGVLVDTITVGSGPNAIAFHPASPLVYFSLAGAGSVVEVNTTTKSVVRTFFVGSTPQGIAVAHDGSELYIANEGFGFQIWNLSSGSSGGSLFTGAGSFGLALSPDGSRLALTQTAAGRVLLIDRVARAVVRSVVTDGVPRRVAFSGDGSVVVVPNEGGWVDFIRN